MCTETPLAALTAAPVESVERVIALDVLRGFALLGILVMNIQAFSMPEAAYFLPTVYGSLEGVNLWVWAFSHIFFDQKFMALFSMLFGAGLVLQTVRLENRGATGLYYRRIFWLLLIGLAHAYLLWSGDILVTYAICGALIFCCRNCSPRKLLLAGCCVLLVVPLLNTGSYLSLPSGPPEVLADLLSKFDPSQTAISAEIAAYQGDWLTQMQARVPATVSMQTTAMLFYLLWRAGGLMLVGMALYKWGVFSATCSVRFYYKLILFGFVFGLPLVVYGILDNFSHQWDALYALMGPGSLYNYFGSMFIAMAYVGVVMRVVQSELFANLKRRLAAVGRMALTNYLMHTVAATFIFYGHGLGLFGAVPRWGQLLVVLLICCLQLYFSPLWLHKFRFGPVEWLWRTLTYLRLQPMKLR